MKKKIIIFWSLICMFWGGCAIEQKDDLRVNGSHTKKEKTDNKIEPQANVQSNIELIVQNGQISKLVTETQILQLGHIADFGMGFLVSALPERADEDYKLYFFSVEDASEDIAKPFSEIHFNLEEADYIFSDVREENASIGHFSDIYFCDVVEVRNTDKIDLIIIARYEVDGNSCYDTRAYMWNESVCCLDEELMWELNEKYRNTDEYPIEELFLMSCD